MEADFTLAAAANPKRMRSPGDPPSPPPKKRAPAAASASGDLAPPTPGGKKKNTKEKKKEKKVITPDTPLDDVKDLLATGLLEGVPIFYIQKTRVDKVVVQQVLLEGAVKNLKYQCGCLECKNAVVLTAMKFEQHAKTSTNNPNGHICFKSGINIYNLVKVLKNHRLGSLDEVMIEEKIGCPVNKECFEVWKASFENGDNGVQKTRRSSIELLQAQAGIQHQRTSANDYENVRIPPGLHSEPCSNKSVGIENFQTNTWLQLQTPCKNNYGAFPTQQEVLAEPFLEKINDSESLQTQRGIGLQTTCVRPGLNTELRSDKILTSSDGVESSEASTLLQLQTTHMNSYGNLQNRPELYTDSSSEKSLISRSVESLQSQTGLQHQRECANDYESVPTQLRLHTETCSDESGNGVESPQALELLLGGACANGSEPVDTLLGLRTEPYSQEVSGVENVEAWTGIQLQGACANSYPAIHTQPEAHTEPYSNESSQGLAVGHSASGSNEFSSIESPSLVGSPHLVSVANNKFSPRGPTEDGMDAIPSISTPVVQEKRFTEKDKSKHENRSSFATNVACSPNYDVGTPQRNVYSRGGGKKRDVDLHRLIFMENGLPDGSELEYRQKGEVKLRGRKQGMGILCNCCNEMVSPSKFELHAGYKEKRQPYKHIYKDGVSLHKLCLSLWNGQSSSMCTACGCGEDLVSCGQCQKAFHAACLKLNCGADDELYCPCCKINPGSSNAARPSSATKITSSSAAKPRNYRVTRIIKNILDELTTGCVLCKAKDFSDAVEIKEESLILCNQCEREYHVGCLKHRGICDLKEYDGCWYCCTECDFICFALKNLVFHGPKLVPESLLGFLKKNEEKNLTNELGVAVQWQLLGGKYQVNELIDKVALIFQDAFDPIIKGGFNLITGMIWGKEDWAGEYFDGMFCVVLRIESVIVSAGILRIFGRGVAELPLVATSIGSRRKGYFRTLLSLVEWLLSRLKVEVLMLPVACEEEPMWINKFGFTKMTEERWIKYASKYPLLTFEKMTVLEKAVPRSFNDEGRDDLFPFTFSENFTSHRRSLELSDA